MLISLLAGAQLGGLLGVVVAVPIAVVIKVALEAVRSRGVSEGESRRVEPPGEAAPVGVDSPPAAAQSPTPSRVELEAQSHQRAGTVHQAKP